MNAMASKIELEDGDLIVSINGQSVSQSPSLGALLATCRGKTELVVLRAGQAMTVTVELPEEH